MYNYNNLFSQHLQDIMKQHSETMNRIAEPFLNLQKSPAFVELQNNLERISRTAERIAFKNQEAFSRIADLNNLTGLKALSEQMELISEGLSAKFSVDLVGPLLKDLRTSFNGLEISEDKLSSALKEIEQTDFVREFENKVSNVEKGHSTAQGVSIGLNEVLTFLMLILMLIQSYDNSTDKALEQLSDGQELTNQLLQRLVELNNNTPELINKSKSEDHKLLIANDSSPLQSQPEINSDTLISTFKGQRLDLLEEKEDWYKVQFYNTSNSVTDTGWIQKKNILPEIEIGQAQTKKLGDVCEIIGGGTPSTKVDEYFGGDIAWLTPADLTDYKRKYISKGRRNLTKSGLDNSSAKLLPKGSVLFSSRAPIGYVAISEQPLATNQGFRSLIPSKDLHNEYLYYFLKSAKHEAEKLASGTTFKEISGKNLGKLEVPVPPLPTQHRIVEKIEELFSELDNGVENLKKAQKQLKTYRQAVLKDAFEGKLTKEWREQQTDLPTPEELLQQIKAERKAQRQRELAEWEKEVEQWEKDGEPGRKPRKPRKPKNLPEIERNNDLNNLPNRWTQIRLGKAVELENGDRSKNYPNKDEYVDEGVAWINTGHIEPDGTLSKKRMNYIKEEKYNSLRSGKIKEGDLVYCLRGATFGKTAFVRPFKKGAIASSLVIVRSLNKRMRKFIFYFLISPAGRNQLFKYDNGSAQPNLSATSVSKFILPLPSYNEQEQIVNEIESRLSVVDQLEQTIKENLKKAEALRQSILKKAFGGELVK